MAGAAIVSVQQGRNRSRAVLRAECGGEALGCEK